MLLALGTFLLCVAIHAVVMRASPGRKTVPKFVLVGVVAGLGLLVTLVHDDGWGIPTWAGLLLFALLCELYIFSFTLVMSSVSARLLLLLRQRPRTTDEIGAAFGPEATVGYRVRALVANGFLEDTPAGPRPTPSGLKTLRTFDLLRRVFRHPD